jgi:stage V sporulation protein K
VTCGPLVIHPVPLIEVIRMTHGTWRTQPKARVDQVIADYEHGHIALAEALQQLGGGGRLRPSPLADSGPQITRERLLALLTELDSLVGLDAVKQTVNEIFAYLYMQERRREHGLKTDPVVLHMVFKGNPGTGKTTVARIMARMFQQVGLLEKGHLVEVERADLVGEYIGHTAQKTREQIRRALGGVLFIDEAYSLARGGEKDFGREAIDCLVKHMEDYRNQFVAVIAGYEHEMDLFLRANPGLPSRFPIHLTFPDYETPALLEIARRMAAERQYRLSADAELKLRRMIEHAKARQRWGEPFSNARWVRNVVERAIRRHAVRLFDARVMSREQMTRLEAEDLEEGGPA